MAEGDEATTMSYQDRFLWALQRDTTVHDWCEPNYTHSTFIAEFYNTVCNRINPKYTIFYFNQHIIAIIVFFSYIYWVRYFIQL